MLMLGQLKLDSEVFKYLTDYVHMRRTPSRLVKAAVYLRSGKFRV